MEVKKSVIEEAMLDAKKIQEALKANTREILRSVAREEIDGLVKESLLKEDDFEEEDIETNDEPESDVDITSEPDGETTVDVNDTDGDSEVEIEDDQDPKDSEQVAPEIEQDNEMDADAFEGDDLDLTDASDDDVISIYKKLSGDDEIEIVGDDIHLNVSEPGEYVIKGAAAAEEPNDELSGFEEVTDEPDDSEVDYEIELGDDEDEAGEEANATDDAPEETEAPDDAEEGTEDASDDNEEKPEDDIEEQIATNRVAQNRAGGDLTKVKGPGARQGASLSESEKAKKIVSESAIKYKKLLTESNKLKTENEEFRKALSKFRGMLTETVVFNANLSYVTKLFMEHSTTKDEKKNIIKRFDEEVSNLKESKKLYKTIANELSGRKPIAESIESKLIKEGTTSSSKRLSEATAYVDPSTQRILDLINRVEKK